MTLRFVGATCAFGLVLLGAHGAHAQDVTVCFAGTVRSVTGMSFDGVSQGVEIHGQYTFNLQAADINDSTEVGDYWHDSAPYGVMVRIGDVLFQSYAAAPQFVVEVINDYQGSDDYRIASYRNIASYGIHPQYIGMSLTDPTMANLNSAALPSAPLVASTWSQPDGFWIVGYGLAYDIRADISGFDGAPDCGIVQPPTGALDLKVRSDRKGRAAFLARRVFKASAARVSLPVHSYSCRPIPSLRPATRTTGRSIYRAPAIPVRGEMSCGLTYTERTDGRRAAKAVWRARVKPVGGSAARSAL
jgi:hypothetical protein